MGENCELTGISGAQTEIRDLYCDGCGRKNEHLRQIEDPYKMQYPQDDNRYPQEEEDVDPYDFFIITKYPPYNYNYKNRSRVIGFRD
jgi:hypothetical protein